MTLRMQGFVTFERDAEGNPIEGTDVFVAQHDRDDYRPMIATHVRPKLVTHVEDGHRTTYVELEPVVDGESTHVPRKLLHAVLKQHHAFPEAA